METFYLARTLIDIFMQITGSHDFEIMEHTANIHNKHMESILLRKGNTDIRIELVEHHDGL